MFKDSHTSVMQNDHFGAGSIIEGSGKQLVVADPSKTHVSAIDMLDFIQRGSWVEVKDVNHLTYSEFSDLVAQIEPQYTTSDFSGIAKGLKQE